MVFAFLRNNIPMFNSCDYQSLYRAILARRSLLQKTGIPPDPHATAHTPVIVPEPPATPALDAALASAPAPTLAPAFASAPAPALASVFAPAPAPALAPVFEATDPVDKAMQQPDATVIARDNASNIEITASSLKTLLPGSWLNDEVINFYVSILNQKYGARQGFYIFNSFLATKIMKNGRTTALVRWFKKANIDFGVTTKVLCPVHVSGNHWALCAIDLKAERYDFYDSLGGQVPQELKERLPELIKAVFKALQGNTPSYTDCPTFWRFRRAPCPRRERL